MPAAVVNAGWLFVVSATVEEGGPVVAVELMGWDDGSGDFVPLPVETGADVAVTLLMVVVTEAVVASELAAGWLQTLLS